MENILQIFRSLPDLGQFDAKADNDGEITMQSFVGTCTGDDGFHIIPDVSEEIFLTILSSFDNNQSNVEVGEWGDCMEVVHPKTKGVGHKTLVMFEDIGTSDTQYTCIRTSSTVDESNMLECHLVPNIDDEQRSPKMQYFGMCVYLYKRTLSDLSIIDKIIEPVYVQISTTKVCKIDPSNPGLNIELSMVWTGSTVEEVKKFQSIMAPRYKVAASYTIPIGCVRYDDVLLTVLGENANVINSVSSVHKNTMPCDLTKMVAIHQ